MADQPVTRLIKIGARVVRHTVAITFQLTFAIPPDLCHRVLEAIHRLRRDSAPKLDRHGKNGVIGVADAGLAE